MEKNKSKEEVIMCNSC